MKKIYLMILLSINLSCFSQVGDYNGKCKFDNSDLEVFSQSIDDTVYLKVTLRNRISEEFVHSDRIRMSYKTNKNEEYTEPYEIETVELDKIIDRNLYAFYKIIKPCLLEYEKYFFENNTEGITKLKSNDIPHYYYKVNLTIIPEKD